MYDWFIAFDGLRLLLLQIFIWCNYCLLRVCAMGLDFGPFKSLKNRTYREKYEASLRNFWRNLYLFIDILSRSIGSTLSAGPITYCYVSPFTNMWLLFISLKPIYLDNFYATWQKTLAQSFWHVFQPPSCLLCTLGRPRTLAWSTELLVYWNPSFDSQPVLCPFAPI